MNDKLDVVFVGTSHFREFHHFGVRRVHGGNEHDANTTSYERGFLRR